MNRRERREAAEWEAEQYRAEAEANYKANTSTRTAWVTMTAVVCAIGAVFPALWIAANAFLDNGRSVPAAFQYGIAGYAFIVLVPTVIAFVAGTLVQRKRDNRTTEPTFLY